MTPNDRQYGKLLLAGYLSGLVAREIGDRQNDGPLRGFRPVYDADGLALPRFEVDLPSGTYTVTVIDNGAVVHEDD